MGLFSVKRGGWGGGEVEPRRRAGNATSAPALAMDDAFLRLCTWLLSTAWRRRKKRAFGGGGGSEMEATCPV